MRIFLGALQWIGFMVACSVVAPIAIADLFQLGPIETTGLVQRTMFALGLGSLLQGLLGHKLPINESPAGLWWCVFVIFAGLGTVYFNTNVETLRALEGAMIISGFVFILLSIFKMIGWIVRLFTPVITGVYLILLVLQLSGSFIKGMFGIGYHGEGIDLRIAGFSVALVLFTAYLSHHKYSRLRQYSILISLAVGWILFSMFKLARPISFEGTQWFQAPKPFAFGPPIYDSGLIMTSIFVTLLLITNMVASIRAIESVIHKEGQPIGQKVYQKGAFAAGINQMISGCFSAIGTVPVSGAAGFVGTTKIKELFPFILGSSAVTVASFFPHIMAAFAFLPAPVGYSVMFIVFAKMIEIAFSEIDNEKDVNRIRTVIGISLLTGVGIMYIPSEAFSTSSPIIISILNNGLIVGTLTGISVDQFTKRMQRKRKMEK